MSEDTAFRHALYILTQTESKISNVNRASQDPPVTDNPSFIYS